jgi:hypothetical protein
MKTSEELLAEIDLLERNHQNDGDGGYSEVDDIVGLYKRLSDEERELLTEILLQFIREEHPRVWGVALLALVRQGHKGTGPMLVEMVKQKGRSAEWYGQLVLWLAYMGYKEVADFAVSYVEDGLDGPNELKPSAIPILAALCRVQLDSYLKLAPRFLVDSVNTPLSKTERIVGSFIGNIAKEDTAILGMLLDAAARIDREAAKKLTILFKEYLDKPWVETKVGAECLMRLKQELKK